MSCLDFVFTVGIFAPFQIVHRRSPLHISEQYMNLDPPHEGVCVGGSALYLPPTTHRLDETAIAYLLSYSKPLDQLKKYI